MYQTACHGHTNPLKAPFRQAVEAPQKGCEVLSIVALGRILQSDRSDGLVAALPLVSMEAEYDPLFDRTALPNNKRWTCLMPGLPPRARQQPSRWQVRELTPTLGHEADH